MSTFVHKVNRGSAFKNEEGSTKKSDYSGSINVEGVLYFLDVYIDESVKGKYLNVAVQKKQKQEGALQPTKTYLEEDIPQ